MSAVKAKSEGEAEPKRPPIGEARSPDKRANKEASISKKSESAASTARSYGKADPSMAREGETELLACFAFMATGIKEKSSSGKAFSISQGSQARELRAYGRSMGRGRDRSSQALSREKMQDRGEGEAAPLGKLGIGRARSEKALHGEAEASQEGEELLWRPRRAGEASGSGRSEKSRSHGEEKRRSEEARRRPPLKRRRPKPQERRERERGERESFSAASMAEAAERAKEKPAEAAKRKKGAAKGAASRAEEAKEISFP